MRSKVIIVVVLMTVGLMSSGMLFAGGKSEDDSANKQITWKLGHLAPPDHVDHKRLERMAERVSERTGGNFKIEIYPSSQLGDAKAMFEGTQMGSIDAASLAAAAIGSYAGYPKLSVLDAPFIYNDLDHLHRVIKSDVVRNMVDELVTMRKTRIIGLFYGGTRNLTTKDTPVLTPNDAKGLKVRAPDIPIYMDAVRAIGANPTPMAFAEIYTGLQQGVIDGQENPYMQIVSMKFYEVQKYLILTRHIISVGAVIVNENRYNQLPGEYKQILAEACQEGIAYAESIILEEEVTLLKQLQTAGMTVMEPNRDLFIRNAEFIKGKYSDQWGPGLYDQIRAQ